MKQVFEDVANYMMSAIDKEISALEEQKEAAVKALEEQRDAEIKAVQDQIDAAEEKKKKLQEQIDLINEGNEARERELALQEALYNLDKMQHDRTKQVYSEEEGMHYETDTTGKNEMPEYIVICNLETNYIG